MMASDEKSERPPKDLSVPETMKIAALLAELMPPGAVGAKPATIRRADSMDDIGGIGGGNLSTPSLEIEDLDDVEPVAPAPSPAVPVEPKAVVPGIPATTANVVNPAPRPAPKITAVVTQSGWKPPKPEPQAPKPAPPAPEPVRVAAELPPTPVPPPLPAPKAADPSEEPTGDFMGRYNWKKTPDFKAPSAPKPPAADPELIPVGNLSAASYFTLVNWRNDPQRVRQPRRADFGLDEQSRAVAQQNPFYVLGQPRRPERATVAEVLAEIKW
jgi:hypothetical protein